MIEKETLGLAGEKSDLYRSWLTICQLSNLSCLMHGSKQILPRPSYAQWHGLPVFLNKYAKPSLVPPRKKKTKDKHNEQQRATFRAEENRAF